jgi:hypothetical protein
MKFGAQRLYDNIAMGLVLGTEESMQAVGAAEDDFFFVFSDLDNNEVHMMKMKRADWPKYKEYVETKLNEKTVHTATPADLRKMGLG